MSDDTTTPPGASRRPVEELEVLRARLDELDRQLLDTIRERLACCCRIALVKRDNAVPMMQPHRIDLVQGRAAAYAGEHGIDRAFLRRLYDLVIAETCRLEDAVMAPDGTADSGTRRPDR